MLAENGRMGGDFTLSPYRYLGSKRIQPLDATKMSQNSDQAFRSFRAHWEVHAYLKLKLIDTGTVIFVLVVQTVHCIPPKSLMLAFSIEGALQSVH